MADKEERMASKEERVAEAEKRVKRKKIMKTSIGFGVLLIIIALIAIAVVKNAGGTGKYDEFAKCLTEKGFAEYGAYWCPHCAEQKKLFGKSFQYVNYVECDPRGGNANPGLCTLKGIEGYPTWITGDNEKLSGVQSLENLAELSGCELIAVE